MKLLECYVENFGKLSAFSHRFSDGLNSFVSENGFGKTTLSVFIKAMFYGLSAERKQSLDENERKRYLPWQGGRYGGSLTFEKNGKTYRIERTFGAKASDDNFSLVFSDTGEISHDYSENIGLELFDIDAQGFERTLFLSEKNLSGAVNNDTIAAKLSDLVGTTGDVGAVSAALLRLEDRRKYYHKRGGSGEIASVKAKISDCDAALVALERRRQEAEEKERKLHDLELRISDMEKERERIDAELSAERVRASGRTYRQQYAQMRASIEADRSSLAALDEFFRSGVPEAFEIDDARDAMREAERLRSERRDTESPELSELRDFFTRDTDFAEIERIKTAISHRDDASAHSDAIRISMQHAQSELTERLGGVLPSSAEVLAAMPSRGKSIGKALIPVLASLCLAFIIVYILIPNAIWLVVSSAAMIAAIAVTALTFGRTTKSEVLTVIKKSCSSGTNIKELYELLLAHEASVERDLAKISELRREIIAHDAVISEFINRYAHRQVGASDAISVIWEKYRKYYTLSEIAKQSESARKDYDIRIKFLEEKAKQFTDKYATETADPYEEIRSKLNSRSYVQMTLARRERECREFMELHGIREDEDVSFADSTVDIADLERMLNACKAGLMELRREQALTEREYNDAMADVERTDEVGAAREALCERLAECVESLSIITATADMLSRASDAITSRYIGGTKERFKKYMREIDHSDGEFAMGTDFALKKLERGETRAAESYSRGMRDLHAFCLRMALSDSLYGDDLPFIVLDDPFTALDNERLERAKELIQAIAGERQVIYFTCSKERAIQ